MKPPDKIWQLLPHDRAAVETLAAQLAVSPIVAQLLLNRGITETESARRFLASPFKGLHDPKLLPGAAHAAERLHAAIQQKRRICIYGDYDVDGLTGTAILWQLLHLLGLPADFYVPNRLEEGYGLNVEALRKIAQAGTTLVVTVDCGIASLDEAEEARRLGLELIITDHHEFKDRLPDAEVLVHPRLPGTSYPFGGLSGSGVAFKVAWALCQRMSGNQKVTPQFREFLLDSVTLAALGMIADVVPLHDENRIIVKHGLARLKTSKCLGLQAMLAAAKLNERDKLKAEDISFFLAPRMNAAGRLGCARLVVELLATTSQQRATDLARYLEGENENRRHIERRILAQARELLADQDLDRTSALVLASSDWHAGVIGIVASRLVEMYGRPALMIALNGSSEMCQGSGRSVPGFALHEALHACGEDLVSFGGHAAAAGFRIAQGNIDAFRERFCAYSEKNLTGKQTAPRLVLDAEVPLHMMTHGLVEALGALEPYGAGNQRPLFLAGPVQVTGHPRKVGGGERHLSFRVCQEGATLRAIGFNLADRMEELLAAEGWCYLVCTPSFNDYQGWRSVQLEVKDFQPGTKARLE